MINIISPHTSLLMNHESIKPAIFVMKTYILISLNRNFKLNLCVVDENI